VLGVVREVRCWCYCAKKMVTIRGEVVGRRAADLLKIFDCLEANCRMRGDPDCLIGKMREGRWR